MSKKYYAAAVILFLLLFDGLTAAETDRPATRRFGIFVGSNNGGRERAVLRYAVSDAKSVSRVFSTMGGITDTDNILLVEPTINEINRQLDAIARLSAQSKRNVQRTELVFYYSGHSDENGILPNNKERYDYRELRSRINSVRTDMMIVILDSCSSGAITRAKGGAKTQPFLFDSSVSTEGYAFLTSSSENETSQESDRIESSYFTHSILAGLRGAADSVGDGRVTLNELYRFAYTETLAKTETSLYGAQHPSYDIQISGSGDVVLTDIKETSASLLFAEDISGRISIRDNADFLVAELTKVTSKPLELGLEPGRYQILLQRGDNFYRTEVTLPENKRTSIGMADFQMIAAASGDRKRGDETAGNTVSGSSATGAAAAGSGQTDENVPLYPVNFQVLPGIDVFGHGKEKATNNFFLALLVGMGHNINGLGAAYLGQIHTGYVNGVQGSGLFNSIEGDFKGGIQGAGIFNKAGGNFGGGIQGAGILNYIGGNFLGIQGAGIASFTYGDFKGIQGSGIANYSGGNFQGIQGAGILSYRGGNFKGIQGAGILNYSGADATGIEGAGIANYSKGNISGIQGAGIFNYNLGSVRGLQGAGIFNFASELYGVQAGLVNVNKGGQGAMFGVVNISDSETIVPFGLVNIFKNGIFHPAVYVDDMLFTNISLRSGSKHFYTILSTGLGGRRFFNKAEDQFYQWRAGVGFEYTIKKVFFDLDYTSGGIINMTRMRDDEEQGIVLWGNFNSSHTQVFQLRLTAGYKLFEHLGVFGGISYDYFYKDLLTSPEPKDFGGSLGGITRGRNVHKFGFFGGIQF